MALEVKRTLASCPSCGGPFAPHAFFRDYCPRCEAPGASSVVGLARSMAALDADAAAQRDELRAILAPLLDDPLEACRIYYDDTLYVCRFCDAEGLEGGPPTSVLHRATCPVLRRDALLGRS